MFFPLMLDLVRGVAQGSAGARDCGHESINSEDPSCHDRRVGGRRALGVVVAACSAQFAPGVSNGSPHSAPGSDRRPVEAPLRDVAGLVHGGWKRRSPGLARTAKPAGPIVPRDPLYGVRRGLEPGRRRFCERVTADRAELAAPGALELDPSGGRRA